MGTSDSQPSPAEEGAPGKPRFLPLLFALTLIPLAFSVVRPDGDIESRLKATLERHPEVRLDQYQSLDEFLGAVPEGRIDGALLVRTTWMHWFFAGAAAVGFWGLLRVLFPLGKATTAHLWATGLFTGVAGILLLLGFQYLADWTQGWVVIPRSIVGILFWIVKMIGWSYRAADDPSNGFLLSMVGFTLGVGLCEELCKALPLLWRFRRPGPALDLRGTVMWGLATGIGFGVSEGIMYSARYYNGLSTAGIYGVRFVSCVALHAVWSALSGVYIWRRQQEVEDADSLGDWAFTALLVLGPSMILHGFYDTLLKRDQSVAALGIAAASFALFFAMAAWTLRRERGLPAVAA